MFFPKQFTVGVLNSILKSVHLVSGAVSSSGRFVFKFICLPIHLSSRSCIRGCVRLRGICLPIHLSSNSFVSQVLCQRLCPSPEDLSSNSFVRLVSGAVSASGRFVSQFICLPGPCLPIHLSPRSCGRGWCPPPGNWFPNSFVSQFICLPGPEVGGVSASGGFVSQFICPPCVRGCVRLRTICLPIHLSPIHLSLRFCGRACVRLRGIGCNSFVSQFICLPGPVVGVCPPPRDLSSNSFVRLVRGCVRLRTICLPIHLSSRSLSPYLFVSQFICLPGPVSGAVSASGGFVFQFICPPCVRGCVRLRTFVFQFICLEIHLSPRSLSPNSFVFLVLYQGLASGDLSPNSFVSQFICLPGPVSGAVSASGGFVSQFICPPCVRGCVAVSASGRFVSQFICLQIHLSPRSLSSNSFVSQVLWQGLCPPPGDWLPNSFVSQFICLPGPVVGVCPPPGDLSPNSFVRLVSGAVSASGRFVSQFICLPIHLSPGPCLPIHVSPRSCGRGCVRLWGIGFPIHLSPNSFVSQVLCQGLCPPSGDLSPNSFVFHHSPNSLLLGYSILS